MGFVMARRAAKFARLGGGLVLLASLSYGAQAQTPPPMTVGLSNSVATMTGGAPRDAKDARARGDNLVATQHATGEFENITNGVQIKIRHIKSGVICDTPGLLMVSPPTELETLSSTAKYTCINIPNNFQNDLTITRNNYTLDAHRALAAIVVEARAETPQLNYHPARVSWDEAPAQNVNSDQALVARLSTGDKPDSRYMYVSVAIRHGWIISDSIRGALAQKDQIELTGAEMMRRAMRDSASRGAD